MRKTKTLWKRAIAANLTLILLMMPLAKAKDSLKIPNLAPNHPNGLLYLDKQRQNHLAKYIKNCQLVKKDLDSTKAAYQVCTNKNELAPAWWQSPIGIVGIAVLSLAGGYALGTAIK